MKEVEKSFAKLQEGSGERKELDSNFAEIQARAAERKKRIESNLNLLNTACDALPGPEELAAIKRRVSARTVQGGVRGRTARREKARMDAKAAKIQAAMRGRHARKLYTDEVIAAADVADAIARGSVGGFEKQNELLSHLKRGEGGVSPIQIQAKQTMSLM